MTQPCYSCYFLTSLRNRSKRRLHDHKQPQSYRLTA